MPQAHTAVAVDQPDLIQEASASAPEAAEQVVVAVEAATPMVEATQVPTSEPEAPAVAVIADEAAALPASIEAVVKTVADAEDIPATAAAVEASAAPAAEVHRRPDQRHLALGHDPFLRTSTAVPGPAASSRAASPSRTEISRLPAEPTSARRSPRSTSE